MTLIHEKTFRTLESQYREGHAEILRCLEGDAPRALEVMRQHFRNVRELLVANGQGPGEGPRSDPHGQRSARGEAEDHGPHG
jgi:hypothetical protein